MNQVTYASNSKRSLSPSLSGLQSSSIISLLNQNTSDSSYRIKKKSRNLDEENSPLEEEIPFDYSVKDSFYADETAFAKDMVNKPISQFDYYKKPALIHYTASRKEYRNMLSKVIPSKVHPEISSAVLELKQNNKRFDHFGTLKRSKFVASMQSKLEAGAPTTLVNVSHSLSETITTSSEAHQSCMELIALSMIRSDSLLTELNTVKDKLEKLEGSILLPLITGTSTASVEQESNASIVECLKKELSEEKTVNATLRSKIRLLEDTLLTSASSQTVPASGVAPLVLAPRSDSDLLKFRVYNDDMSRYLNSIIAGKLIQENKTIFLENKSAFANFSRQLNTGLQHSRLYQLLPNDNGTPGPEVLPTRQLENESNDSYRDAQRNYQFRNATLATIINNSISHKDCVDLKQLKIAITPFIENCDGAGAWGQLLTEIRGKGPLDQAHLVKAWANIKQQDNEDDGEYFTRFKYSSDAVESLQLDKQTLNKYIYISSLNRLNDEIVRNLSLQDKTDLLSLEDTYEWIVRHKQNMGSRHSSIKSSALIAKQDYDSDCDRVAHVANSNSGRSKGKLGKSSPNPQAKKTVPNLGFTWTSDLIDRYNNRGDVSKSCWFHHNSETHPAAECKALNGLKNKKANNKVIINTVNSVFENSRITGLHDINYYSD